jgi:hypothetical protein
VPGYIARIFLSSQWFDIEILHMYTDGKCKVISSDIRVDEDSIFMWTKAFFSRYAGFLQNIYRMLVGCPVPG